MSTPFRRLVLPSLVCCLVLPSLTRAQEALPAVDREPFLRVEAGGPKSYVTALAFSPDGRALYAAGWDKVVHVYRRDPATGEFRRDPSSTLRLPIGPGLRGAINTLSVSDDGRWLAVGGHSVVREGGTFRRPGRVIPSEGGMSDAMRRDEGTIFVMDLRQGRTTMLRGHLGSVVSLAFAPNPGDSPLLVSAGREWKQDPAGGSYVGTVRAWDVLRTTQRQAYFRGVYLPEPRTRVGLALRRTGSDLNQVQVGIAWGDGKFRVWNLADNQLESAEAGRYSNTVTLPVGSQQFYCGGISRNGEIRIRNGLELSSKVALGSGEEPFVIPRAMAADQRGMVATVGRVVPRDGGTDGNRFALKLLRDGEVRSATLWPVPRTGALPSVAVTTAGNAVAVAGDTDHSIWIWQASDLSATARPLQILRNQGHSWDQVAFVDKGGTLGVQLKSADRQFTFQLTGESGPANAEGWQSAVADAAGWSLGPAEKVGSGLKMPVLRNEEQVSEIRLPDNEQLSTYGFLPRNDSPVVAVASHELGQPSLRLFRADTGETLRQLTGHTQTIRGLAFHKDGQVLVSSGGDQTLCFWDLRDLGSILDRHGMLPGVAVTSSGPLAVTRVRSEAPSSLQTAFEPGDLLHSLRVMGATQRLQNARGFLTHCGMFLPGVMPLSKFPEKEYAAT